MKKALCKKALPHREEMEARSLRREERRPSTQGDLANQVQVRRLGALVAAGKYNVKNTRGKR